MKISEAEICYAEDVFKTSPLSLYQAEYLLGSFYLKHVMHGIELPQEL